MSRRYGASPLWIHNCETRLTKEAVSDLTGFKSGGANFKLALWDPRANGVRYLKALIYNASARLTSESWTRLRRTRNREVGDPIAVRYNGEPICLDYLQAVLELEFIANHLELDGLSILEIGAGYGRTCHVIMSNCDVAAYHIVDLDNSLELARKYLGAVLDREQFAKIQFRTVDDVDTSLGAARLDLCINIDSFAEMEARTVENYLSLINDGCRYFYVNNPVGKYLDKSLDNHSQGADVVALAMETGLLRKVIDIHDSQAVEAQSRRFTDAYVPGDGWECIASSRAALWSYYWQALYRSEGRG